MGKLQNKSFIDADRGAPAGAGEVFVSAADTTAEDLDPKLEMGFNLTQAILNPGGDEQIELTAPVLDVLAVVESSLDVDADDLDIILSDPAVSASIFLPPLALTGNFLTIFCPGPGDALVIPDGVETIDGLTSLTISAGNSIDIFPFSAEWNVI